jgi:glycosyltransferase involved in cell wall biosynthesis
MVMADYERLITKARRPMKLALITETFPPQFNGVSLTLGKLTDFMAGRGHKILVIHPEYDSSASAKVTEAHHFEILQLPALSLPFYQEIKVPRPPFTGMKKRLGDFQPDLVHIATEAPLGLSALRYCSQRKWPVVSSFHTNFDSYASHYGISWMVPAVARYLRWFHNRTLATFVPSKPIIDRLEYLGFERLKLWPRGVDTDLYSVNRPGATHIRSCLGIALDSFVVGHCGRLAPEKNIDFLEKTFQCFLRDCQGDHLIVVGDGPSRKSFEKALKSDSSVGERVHFTGYKRGEELADYYSAMNAFAFASRTETFGNVILEAMSSGLPVVAIAEGGPIDVIQHSVTGELLQPDAEPAAMAKILSSWSTNRQSAEIMGFSAREYASKQTWNTIMGRLESDYLQILQKSESNKKRAMEIQFPSPEE